MSSILSADNKLVTGTILRRLFDPTESRNEFGHRVFGLYNGTDGIAPPPYLGRTFDETESHHIASQASQIDSADIEDAVRLITRKGFGIQNGCQLLILANPDEAENIMAWRAGQTDLLQSSLTRAVYFSALTTATAFGSLWLSSHPGTSSMGKLLALSLLTTLAAAVLFQPVLMGKPRELRDG